MEGGGAGWAGSATGAVVDSGEEATAGRPPKGGGGAGLIRNGSVSPSSRCGSTPISGGAAGCGGKPSACPSLLSANRRRNFCRGSSPPCWENSDCDALPAAGGAFPASPGGSGVESSSTGGMLSVISVSKEGVSLSFRHLFWSQGNQRRPEALINHFAMLILDLHLDYHRAATNAPQLPSLLDL